jgi:thiol-disulfide isomerase/thioredoxin
MIPRLVVIFAALGAVAIACRAGEDEPAAVQHAFDELTANLKNLTQYDATFTARSLDSIDGELVTAGRIAQQLPFAFRRDVLVEEVHGTACRREVTVCDGSNGWHVVAATNGTVVNASRWGATAVEDMFFVMLPKSRALLVLPDRTSTYDIVRQSVVFESCERRTGAYVFTGHYRTTTPQYTDMSRVAYAFGPAGMSNYLVRNVVLVINDAGLPVEFTRLNLLDQPVQRVVLSDVRVNVPLPPGTFRYTPPPGSFVFDSDRAREYAPLHAPHPLLGKQAPAITAKYLSGKDATITPGSAPIVLTFFTSWSMNCRKFMPLLETLYQKYAGQGVTFVSISDEKATDTVKKLCKTARLTLPVYIDNTGLVVKNYSIQMVPKVIVINRTGVVVDVFEGNAPGIAKALDDAIRTCVKP